jgi:hypothetical protein
MDPKIDDVDTLLAHFRWLRDRRTDPLRTIMDDFFRQYLDGKGSEGAGWDEAWEAFAAAEGHDPANARLRAIWHAVLGIDPLPRPLAPLEQLTWLLLMCQCPHDVDIAAIRAEFPGTTLGQYQAALQAAVDYIKRDATARQVQAAIFQAWADYEQAKGRPERELVFGACVDALGLVEQRPDGSKYLNFHRLQLIADPELRRLTLAAAWQAGEEHPIEPERDAERTRQ